MTEINLVFVFGTFDLANPAIIQKSGVKKIKTKKYQ
jgi:hypothetical protein